MDTDRNLLFGVLALQADLIDANHFVEACTLWANQKQTSLSDLLVERGWLTAADRADVERLLERKLKKHSGDARAGLAEVTTDAVKQSLATVPDADIRQSLAGMSTPVAPGQVLLSTTAYIPESRDRYTLTRLHAQGGIGRVWLAHDASLGRDVALKELLPERAVHPTVWARFLKEAQVTGQLEHPSIVPIYEMGRRPEDDAPFYTMRFVRGRTLAEAAAAHHRRRAQGEAGLLELRELLGAFVGVCNAVAYAHSRGVLHRDLKPQNVILGNYGEVVLLDWGLAKVTGQADGDGDAAPVSLPTSDTTEATLQGQVLGTPAYMAPEQAEGRLGLLAPATDVYGLGAILYEVLTGKPPFTDPDMPTLLRRVIHDTPERPRQLAVDVPAPLEAVCLKALAKKPAERFGSAKEVAGEIQRWLAGEPVSVYRDPLVIRLGRWARKHRNTVAVSTALLQTGVVVLAVSVVLMGRSRAQVDRERRRAEAVNNFLVKDLLAQADPDLNQAGEKLTVRELLDKAAGALETSLSLKETPEVEGAVRSAIGNTYYGLGLYQLAREQLEQAVACQERERDTPASERIFTKNRLCWVIYKLGSYDETMARQLLAQARAELGPDHEETVYAADTLATIALGNHSRLEAFALLRDNLSTQKRVHGPDHLLTIRAALNFADCLISNELGDNPQNLDEALTILLSSRDAARRLGPKHPQGLYFESKLGFLYLRQGKFALAQDVLSPLLERFEQVLGPDHIDVAVCTENLALAEEGLGRLEAAEKHLLRAQAIRKRQLGEGHALTRRADIHLARICLAQGKQAEAVAWFRFLLAYETDPSGRPTSRPADLPSLDHLGDALSGKGDPASCEQLVAELSRNIQWLTWESDWMRHYVMALQAEAWLRIGEREKGDAVALINNAISALESNKATPSHILDQARACLKRASKSNPDPLKAAEWRSESTRRLEQLYELKQKQVGPDHPQTHSIRYRLAFQYWKTKQLDRSIPLYEHMFKYLEARLGRTAPETLETMANLGINYCEAGRLAEGLPLLEEAHQKGKALANLVWVRYTLVTVYVNAARPAEAIALLQELGPNELATENTRYTLAFLYWKTKQFDKSIPLYEDALKRREAKLGRANPETLEAMANLGVNYFDAGRRTEALPLLEEAYQKGKGQASLAWVSTALLAAYVKAEKTAEAMSLLHEQIDAVRQNAKPGSPELAQVLQDAGKGFLDLKQFKTAEPLLRESLVLRENLVKTNQLPPWRVANAKSVLGAALLGQQEYADAEPLLVAGYYGLKKDEKVLPEGTYILDALQRLVELYEGTGNKDKAAHWQKELDASKAARSASKSP
jgi:hypothetical protein